MNKKIGTLERGISVIRLPISGRFIATVYSLDPTMIHRQLWQDTYATYEEAERAAYDHANRPYTELRAQTFANVNSGK